jgi:invasion protein IalB
MAALGVSGAGADQAKSQVFKSWTLDCATPKPAAGATTAPKAVCVIYQEVHKPDDQTKVLLIASTRYLGADRKPYMIVRLPPVANLQQGMAFQVDKHQAYRAKISSCVQRFCTAAFELKDDLLKQFKSGTQMAVSFVVNPQGDMKATIPLAGFAAALEALQKTGS